MLFRGEGGVDGNMTLGEIDEEEKLKEGNRERKGDKSHHDNLLLFLPKFFAQVNYIFKLFYLFSYLFIVTREERVKDNTCYQIICFHRSRFFK